MASSTEKAPKRRRDVLDRIPLSLLVVVLAALMGGVGWGVIYSTTKGQSAQNEAGTAKEDLREANDQVETGKELAGKNLEFCQDPTIVAALQNGGYDGVCELAIIVRTQSKPGETGKQGDRGPGPTNEQINRAVADWFRNHPLPEGKEPTIEQITTVVAGYLRANPPEPGRPPTAEEIAAATASYIAANIEDFKVQGDKGEKGDPPSAEDVRAAVAAYCAEGNRCRGDQGPQGASVTGMDIHRNGQGICTFYGQVENPANGQVTVFEVQINDGMCDPVEPPVTTTTEEPPPSSEGG